MFRRAWLDEGLDALAPDIMRSLPMRAAWTLVLGLLLALNLDWFVGLAWLAAGAGCLGWEALANRPGHRGPRARLSRLAAIAAASLLWSAMAGAYWSSGEMSLQVLALVLLASLLVGAQSRSFKSASAAIVSGAAPGVALMALPLSLSGLPVLHLVSLALVLLLAFDHVAFDFLQNRANARALARSQADLVAETEAAIAANQAKSSFLAMMSHELRTPMNGVLGMAHALGQSPLSGQQASHVDMLVRSGQGLMAILNDILDISKIEAGKLELEAIAFDLTDAGQRIHDLWSDAASAKGVRLIYEVSPEAPRWVIGDPTRLRQVMTNLVSNALKFTAEGEVRLSVSATGDGRVRIAVSDTGLGLSEDQQARLFQSFVQAEASTTRKFGGTGLGLAICKQLVELMGGEIVVASREGEGATFAFTLPLSEADSAPMPDTEPASVLDLQGVRILVADDNAINQAVAQSILEAFGAVVTAASDGLEALERLHGGAFDVVLMDVHMPRMGGLEALAKIRAGPSTIRRTPVIALTADAMAGVDVRLLAAGFDEVAPKPINPAELVGKIAAVLAQAPAFAATAQG